MREKSPVIGSMVIFVLSKVNHSFTKKIHSANENIQKQKKLIDDNKLPVLQEFKREELFARQQNQLRCKHARELRERVQYTKSPSSRERYSQER